MKRAKSKLKVWQNKKTLLWTNTHFLKTADLKHYFHEGPLGVPVAAVVCLYLCTISLCVRTVWAWLLGSFVAYKWILVSVLACPFCISNCKPQQTGTKILALWAVWLKLFMPCHCELSPPLCSNRKVLPKNTPYFVVCFRMSLHLNLFISLSSQRLPLARTEDYLMLRSLMTNNYVNSWENNY